jgi:hypothetical protein
MHKIQKSKEDGKYHIKGKTYDKLVGKRAEVGHGKAYKTAGGLTIDDLVYIKGRWKSKVKHETAKKELRLQQHGFYSEKGKFGYVKSAPPAKSKKVKPLALNLAEMDKLKEPNSKRLYGIRLPTPQRIPSPHSPSYYGSKYKSHRQTFKKNSSRRSSRSRSSRSSRSRTSS